MKWKRRLVWLGVALIILLLVGFGLFTISKSRTFQFFGTIVPRVETTEKVVALTFDDGPTQYTDEVLAILTEKGVRATFYLIGENMEAQPDAAQRMVEMGHEVGNHSYTHQRFLLKPLGFVAEEVEKTNELIRKTGYEGEITFRPPYGKKLLVLPWYLAQHDIKTIMVDVEAETYMPKLDSEAEKTAFLIDYTVSKTRQGSIILLHPFCQACGATRAAIGPIVDELLSEGYAFVTVSELLARLSD